MSGLSGLGHEPHRRPARRSRLIDGPVGIFAQSNDLLCYPPAGSKPPILYTVIPRTNRYPAVSLGHFGFSDKAEPKTVTLKLFSVSQMLDGMTGGGRFCGDHGALLHWILLEYMITERFTMATRVR
jgi:hypothetical protein